MSGSWKVCVQKTVKGALEDQAYYHELLAILCEMIQVPKIESVGNTFDGQGDWFYPQDFVFWLIYA